MRFEYELGNSKMKETLMRLINDYEKRFSNCDYFVTDEGSVLTIWWEL